MPDLLLELFSEEIPARMQRQAAEDLRRLVTNALVERNLTYEGAQSFVTPRRLTLHVVGLPSAQPNLREERKGPRVGAPDAAIQGFLKSAGLERIEDARIETDPKKGEFYVAVIEKPGRETKDAIAEIIPAIVRSFPWPKSMRWGAASAKPDALRWVRPLRGIVCTLAIPHDASEVVRFEIDGITTGDVTFGHRFMAPAPIQVRRFDDYVEALQKAKVVLDAERRKAIILADASNLAFAQGLDPHRGRGSSGGSRGAGRMAGRADGRIRAGVPRSAARSDPRHHPRQPEVLRASRGACVLHRHGRP